MEKPLISVIMSTYNESEKELKSSIDSILKQTYSNLEFIIVNDNPGEKILNDVLYSIKDSRVHILDNQKNLGLVYSLNRAWKESNGNIIARMDADDICKKDRLEKQLNLMKREDYDLLGCDIGLINGTKNIMHFPTTDADVKKFISWFNCIAHPTWMIKKSLYERLGGYRDIPYCEDYDFILRSIEAGYKIGNMPDIGLMYRVRDNSISNENNIDQYLLSRYLSFNRKRISNLDERHVKKYIKTKEFENKRNKYISYCANKKMIKNHKLNIKNIYGLLFNPYLYMNIIEKYKRKQSEKTLMKVH